MFKDPDSSVVRNSLTAQQRQYVDSRLSEKLLPIIDRLRLELIDMHAEISRLRSTTKSLRTKLSLLQPLHSDDTTHHSTVNSPKDPPTYEVHHGHD